MKTCGSLFAGCGGKTCGAIQAGFTPLWAVEIDPDIANIYRQNIGGEVYIKNILDINPAKLLPPDLLLISPPCPNFSSAKIDRKEMEIDKLLAAKVAQFIRVLKPKMIMLENVPNYRASDSFRTVVNALSGYYWDVQTVNAADFGVPQTRKRLILRASKQPLKLLIPTHSLHPQNTIFGKQKPWVGWWEALKDLISELPEMPLANWQIQRILNRQLIYSVPSGRALLERSGANSSMQFLDATLPAFTIRAMSAKIRPNVTQANILLIAGGNTGPGRIRHESEPAFTISATHKEIHRILLESKSYRVTTRAIASLQSFPIDWIWTNNTVIDTKAIGNAVPPLLARKIIDSLARP